jgi:hypothetical protein
MRFCPRSGIRLTRTLRTRPSPANSRATTLSGQPLLRSGLRSTPSELGGNHKTVAKVRVSYTIKIDYNTQGIIMRQGVSFAPCHAFIFVHDLYSNDTQTTYFIFLPWKLLATALVEISTTHFFVQIYELLSSKNFFNLIRSHHNHRNDETYSFLA